jgi:hypothetical protein
MGSTAVVAGQGARRWGRAAALAAVASFAAFATSVFVVAIDARSIVTRVSVVGGLGAGALAVALVGAAMGGLLIRRPAGGSPFVRAALTLLAWRFGVTSLFVMGGALAGGGLYGEPLGGAAWGLLLSLAPFVPAIVVDGAVLVYGLLGAVSSRDWAGRLAGVGAATLGGLALLVEVPVLVWLLRWEASFKHGFSFFPGGC